MAAKVRWKLKRRAGHSTEMLNVPFPFAAPDLIIDSDPPLHNVQKKAFGQAKMTETAKKRKHQSIA
ncbi:conserved hypothetical protein [delta proteobacterium NaphS2]|nr:conserved hypothetical protein [delta proteobacterium NaphS2]